MFVESRAYQQSLKLMTTHPPSIHAIAWSGLDAAACGRLLPDGRHRAHGVRKPWRGQGVGALVMEHLMERVVSAAMRGRSVSANPRCRVLTKIRFVAEGDECTDCDIPHRDMRKVLLTHECCCQSLQPGIAEPFVRPAAARCL